MGAVTNKYSARRTEYPLGSGVVYASKAEAHRAQELDLLKAAGRIDTWWRPNRLTIWQSERDKITLQPDFMVRALDGTVWAEDVKGGKATQTEAFKIKAKLFRAAFPEVELKILEARR